MRTGDVYVYKNSHECVDLLISQYEYLRVTSDQVCIRKFVHRAYADYYESSSLWQKA